MPRANRRIKTASWKMTRGSLTLELTITVQGTGRRSPWTAADLDALAARLADENLDRYRRDAAIWTPPPAPDTAEPTQATLTGDEP